MENQQKFGSPEAASKGGKARRKALTPERRQEIAAMGGQAKAAKAGKKLMLQATHEADLRIGDLVLECAVLEDESRVVAQGKFMDALGIYYSGWLAKARAADVGTADLPLHLPYKSLKPFAEKHLGDLQSAEVKYISRTGAQARGIRAEVLPRICEIWLDARNEGVLTGQRQKEIATKAEILIRGFAQIGIVALIDEATGFQYERQREALQELLRELLSDELRRWVKTFPDAYFKEMCRLRSVPYRPDMKLPRYFGHLTNDVIYKRLAPGVRDALAQVNPSDGGRRKDRHHQWLSENVGYPKLLQQVGTAVGLMKVADSWDAFKALLDRATPTWEAPTMFDHLDRE